MGQANRMRREAKKRRSGRRSAQGGGRASEPRMMWDRPDAYEIRARIELLVAGGAQASSVGMDADAQRCCEALVDAEGWAGTTALISGVGSMFCSLLNAVWEGGWQPAEVVRAVRRRRKGAHGELMVAAMGAEESWLGAGGAAMPASWSDQVVSLGAAAPPSRKGNDWVRAWMASADLPLAVAMPVLVETLGVLVGLSPIEALLARPSEWRLHRDVPGEARVDDQVLAKVRALLAKAESTGFDAESEALTAKAQELMSRHAIDETIARTKQVRRERPLTRRLAVDDPYASAKSHLLQVVAEANGAQCVWYEDLAMMALVGFASDLDAVEILFTSLLVQASRAMTAKGSVSDRSGRSRTRSFRQSFILAFAGRIHERLVAAADSARTEAERDLSTSVLPVLASRDREVDEALRARFPHLRAAAAPSATNAAGWYAGRTAAEMASLGPAQGMLDGMVAVG